MVAYTKRTNKNCEIEIDYIAKTVSFKVRSREKQNLNYFYHNFYFIVGILFGIILIIEILFKFKDFINTIVFLDWGIRIFYNIGLPTFIILIVAGSTVLFGYISLAIHKFSKTAREAYPKTNAILEFLKEKKKIDLRDKESKYHIIHKNKLTILSTSVVSFKYCYIGYNKITKLKSYFPNKKHLDMRTLITFRKPIVDGLFIWR